MHQAKAITTTSALFLALSFGGVPASGDDFYFRPKAGGPYGNSNGTSYANAWHLDDYAAAIGITNGSVKWGTGIGEVGPGDTLYVCGLHDAGQYDRRIQPTVSGTATDPIVITGACPDDPGTIYGTGKHLASGWIGPDTSGVYYQNYVANASMHNLERQAGTTGDNTVIRLNKEIATGSPAICALTTGTPDGTYCYQPAFGGAPERLYYKPTGGLINNKIVYTGGVERIVILAGVSHIHLKSMKLRMAATDLVRVANADGISILDSDLQWSATRGIRILEDSDNGTISNNVIHDVALGLAMQSGTNANNNDNWLISSNVIHAVDQEGYYCDDDSEGIGIQGGSNSVFEYNEIFDTPGVGINFYTAGGQQQQNNRVRFNRIHDIKDLDPDRCGGVGPLSGRQEKGIQFQKSNLTHNPDDSTGNIVHHNILWNIARTGLRSTSQKSADGPTWSFFNNVVYGADRKSVV